MPIIALAQMQVRPGHPAENLACMLQLIDEARQKGAELIVFPEMSLPGYLLGDVWEQSAFLRDCEACGAEIIAASQDITVVFGNVAIDWQRRNEDGRPRKYNALFAARDGRLIAPPHSPYPFVIKTLLPNYREFDDSRHFFSLRQLAEESGLPLAQLAQPLSLPIGDRVFNTACLICEDGWDADYAVQPLQLQQRCGKLDLIVNISSSPFTLGKNNKRHRVFGAQAAKYEAPLLYLNQVGLQNNGKTVYTFDGNSSLYDAQGRLRYSAPAFEAGLHIISLKNLPAQFPAMTPDDTGTIVQALRYGIRQFLQQTGISRVVIGASGGIDSAVSAALYRSILEPEQLFLINMPSRFNSATTKDLAAQLAQRLGCYYAVVPVQDSLELTMRQFSSLRCPDSPLPLPDLTPSSFVQENIQARDRSSRILAAAAAAWGGGFTCNANKSELTVGYSTLYGDQAGFLAVLGDLWKYQVYDAARFLNDCVYQREVIPQATIDLVPSAELSAAQNVDEGKGDPLIYPYHDRLFHAFMERWQRATPEDVLTWYSDNTLAEQLGCPPELLKTHFSDPVVFIADLERWWNLYSGMGVAKRIQAPPVLAISRRAYGFDHREAQNGPYYTRRYHQLKEQLLKERR